MANAAADDDEMDAGERFAAMYPEDPKIRIWVEGCDEVAGAENANEVYTTLIKRWWHPKAGCIWQSPTYLPRVQKVVEPLGSDAHKDLHDLRNRILRTPKNVASALNRMKHYNGTTGCPERYHIDTRLMDFSNNGHRWTFFGLIHRTRLSFLDNPVYTIKTLLGIGDNDTVLGQYNLKFTALQGQPEPWIESANADFRRVLVQHRNAVRAQQEKEAEARREQGLPPKEYPAFYIPSAEATQSIIEQFIEWACRPPEEKRARQNERQVKHRNGKKARALEENKRALEQKEKELLTERVARLEAMLKCEQTEKTLQQQIYVLQTNNIHSTAPINVQQGNH